jgi:hypothetical protein
MTHRDLIKLLSIEQSDCAKCAKRDYQSWTTKTRPIDTSFHFLGQIDDESLTDGSRAVPFPGMNYWHTEYPINLNYYPQTECNIYQCDVCGGILLTYTEESGHYPEERIRWLQQELVSDASS